MSFEIVLDFFIIILLVPTIYYAFNLNRRLDVLRKSKQELLELIKEFNVSMKKAETGIPQLKDVADGASDKLHDQVAKAQVLRDDLEFINESAENLATRLEKLVSLGRAKVNASSIEEEAKTKEPEKAEEVAKVEKVEKTDGGSKTLLGALAMGEDASGDFENRSEAEKELLEALSSMK